MTGAFPCRQWAGCCLPILRERGVYGSWGLYRRPCSGPHCAFCVLGLTVCGSGSPSVSPYSGAGVCFRRATGYRVWGTEPFTTSIRGVYFGRKAFASITGISMIPMNVLLLAAPLFAGIMFDLQGSYTIPFIAVAAVSFAGSGLFLLLGEPTPLPSRKIEAEG
jgi:hypothetical protein